MSVDFKISIVKCILFQTKDTERKEVGLPLFKLPPFVNN